MEKSNMPPALRRALSAGRLGHAYILSGDADDTGALALEMAAAAVCRGPGEKPCRTCRDCRKAASNLHPDIHTVSREKDKREILVDQMRALRRDAAVLPNEAARKVYIIDAADRMNLSAQNAMLKLFEEPPSFAVFLMATENPMGLLPTVRSRCVTVHLPAGGKEQAANREAAALFPLLEQGDRVGLSALLFSMERADKSDFADFCSSAKQMAVAMLRDGGTPALPAGRLHAVAAAFDRTAQYLDYNVSTGHLAGLLLAELL